MAAAAAAMLPAVDIDGNTSKKTEWFFTEDGSMSVNEACKTVLYHPNLNTILVVTNEPAVKVIDVNSGSLLQKSSLSAECGSQIEISYISKYDKLLVSDGRAVGLRRDHCGMLLLDTILQVAVNKPEDIVKIELPIAEAVKLRKCLFSAHLPNGIYAIEDFVKELDRSVFACEAATRKNHKLAKWCTVCLELPHSLIKSVCTSLVQELKRVNKLVPALAIASAINERLGSLLSTNSIDKEIAAGSSDPVDRVLMYSEAARKETFVKWPHMAYKWALPDQMAQAGFYHHPNSTGDDRALCFTCNVCLVCWEPTDEPWSEHERHSPSCPFVKGEYTQNVPLSVSYATSPAQLPGERIERIQCISSSSCSELMATATSSGQIIVWDVSKQLKKVLQFCIDPTDSMLLGKRLDHARFDDSHFEPIKEAWPDNDACAQENKTARVENAQSQTNDVSVEEILHTFRPSKDVQTHKLCILGRSSHPRPSLAVGLSVRKCDFGLPSSSSFSNGTSNLVQALNDMNQSAQRDGPLDIMKLDECSNHNIYSKQFVPFILVYDIHPDANTKSSCSGSLPGVLSKAQPSTSTAKDKDATDSQNAFSETFYDMCVKPSLDQINEFVVGMQQSFQNDDMKLTEQTGLPPAQLVSQAISQAVNEWPPIQNVEENNLITLPVPSTVKPKTSEQLSEGLLKQCIELPDYLNNEHFYIGEMVPSFDGDHLIVAVNRYGTVEDDASGRSEENHTCGAILVYKVNADNSLNEAPSIVHKFPSVDNNVTSVLLLPVNDNHIQDDDFCVDVKEHSGPLGLVVTTTKQGDIIVYNLSDLQIVATFNPKIGEKFVSVAYLTSIDRLCACSQIGTLCFLQLSISNNDKQTEPCETDSAVAASSSSSSKSPKQLQQTASCDKVRESDYVYEDTLDYLVRSESLLISKPLTSSAMNLMHTLTQFENLTPRFSVTVPPCWTEIQQEQKQRRHPQHVQQQGEAMQHTRSWRLQSDSITWDEHVFEISLAKPCSVGHLDFKFNLHPSLSSETPKIQVTLLQQISGGMSRQMNYKKTSDQREAVDSAINFNIKPGSNAAAAAADEVEESLNSECDNNSNPVLTEEFLDDHNAVILCGPIDIDCCVDLSGQSGIVTMTSPALLKTKCRTFLLHIKALNVDKNSCTKSEASNSNSKSIQKLTQKRIRMRRLSGKVPSLQAMLDQYVTPGSTVERLATSAANKKIELKGCDWFHEVSITIRRTKKTNIPHEKFQRCAILETPTFHDRLIRAACNRSLKLDDSSNLDEIRHGSLDILVWVAAIQMNTPLDLSRDNIVTLVQENLTCLIDTCIIQGDRSISRKCCKLLILCIEYSKKLKDVNAASAFMSSLLMSLLECLPMITNCASSGALRWFFLLLNRVKCLDTSAVGQSALSLLTSVSKQLQQKNNPHHSLLRSRFGLYGTPFDVQLFELDPPTPQKPTSTLLTYAGVVSGPTTTNNNSANNNNNGSSSSGSGTADDVDFRDLLNIVGDKTSSNRLSWLPQNHQMTGLLEVEPLHFVCHAASDGTKMEKMDAAGSGNVADPGSLVPIASNSWYNMNPHSSNVGDAGAVNNNGNKGLGQMSKSSSDLSPLFNSLVSSIQQKQDQLIKLKKQKQKMEQKLSDDNTLPVSNLPLGVPSAAMSSSSNFQPTPTPKTTPLFMTPPLTPPSENAVLANVDADAIGPPVVKLVKPPSTSKESKANDVPLSSSPWHHLLQSPPQQMLVIERMHSGARRFVVLDFGHPVLLTDLMIPSCPDLVSLSVDVWVQSEEYDGQRLVVSTDIGVRSLVISDIQPPAYCQFLKITIIGRYGMSTTRCRIPIGYFYGHTYMLPWERNRYQQTGNSSDQVTASGSQIQAQVTMLNALKEDIHCRYSLACSKLQTVLQPYMHQESANSSHTHYHLQSSRLKDKFVGEEDKKVLGAYEECMQLQQQLNLVCQAIIRLTYTKKVKSSFEASSAGNSLKHLCCDKLKVIADCLLDTLIGLTCSSATIPHPPRSLSMAFDKQVCSVLFNKLCINTTCSTQLNASTLLVRMCAAQPWWGSFLASTFQSLFTSYNNVVFPQDRIFILLTYLGQKSLCTGQTSVFESFLNLLSSTLEPVFANQNRRNAVRGLLDLPFIGWILLFISSCFDASESVFSNAADDGESSSSKKSANRWSFIQGESALQKTNLSKNKGSSRSYRRKLQKRLMHHKQRLEDLEVAKKAFLASTKAMSPINSNLGGSIEAAVKQQEEAFAKTLKQHQSKHFKDILQIRRVEGGLLGKENNGSGGSGSSSSTSKVEPSPSSSSQSTSGQSQQPQPQQQQQPANEVEAETEKHILNYDVCLNVAQRLIGLLLHMDFTSSIDLLLLVCKVLAKVITSSRPCIKLGHVMSKDQLLQLLMTMVKNGQHYFSANWGHQWALHAITCLLLDILENEKNYFSEPSSSSSTEEASNQRPETTDKQSVKTDAKNEASAEGASTSSFVPKLPTSSSSDTGNYMKELPMIMDTDDSSDEYTTDANNTADISDAIIDKRFYASPFVATTTQKKSTGWLGLYNSFKENNNRLAKDYKCSDLFSSSTSNTPSYQLVSTAMDSRLEQGVETTAELRLKIMSLVELNTLHSAIHNSLPTPPDGSMETSSPEDGASVRAVPMENKTTVEMLSACFDSLFLQLRSGIINVELLLSTWLSLNTDSNDGPIVPLSNTALASLLSVLSISQTISLRVWCLFFQSLTINCSFKIDHPSHESSANSLLSQPNLFNVLVKFLSGTWFEKSNKSNLSSVGPMVVQSFNKFLDRLESYYSCDDYSQSSANGDRFKRLLLEIFQVLIGPSGPISCGQGPLDIQSKIIETILLMDLQSIDEDIALSICESATAMVHNYMDNCESVHCCSHYESRIDATSCFGGLFASVLQGNQLDQDDNSSGWLTESRDLLLCSVLKVVCELVKLPIISYVQTSQVNNAASSSQTDEHKTAHGSLGRPPGCSHFGAAQEDKVIYIADKVLSQQSIINDLLSSLSKCSASSMAILLGSGSASSSQTIFADMDNIGFIFGHPISVGDGIFHLLCCLNSKASNVDLILQPVFRWLSSWLSENVLVLTEPLLWFLLRLLDCPTSLSKFHEYGGVELIAQNLVTCQFRLINLQPSLVSMIMQLLCQRLSPASTPTTSSTSRKYTDLESVYEGLNNFAPLGVVTSSNPTAQPADGLIHSVPPHPRTRTPSWSYHFYPEENWIDLTITLPYAILLHEIQIQPHLASLATCPSAVSVDVSRSNNPITLTPLCHPQPTSGLTFIRLQLSKPEIVTVVCLRLHKPNDSTNMGLSQILLIGSTTFGESVNKYPSNCLPSEEIVARSSLGWLRLLHHCLTTSGADNGQLISCAAQVPDLLECCCLLLQMPSLWVYMSYVEKVLALIGQHSDELGLEIIKILLKHSCWTLQYNYVPNSSSVDAIPPTDAVMDILYSLATCTELAIPSRVQTLLCWLNDSLSSQTLAAAHVENSLAPSYIHCIAAILWQCHELQATQAISPMLDINLISLLCDWSMKVKNPNLRQALDSVLCSICYIKPDFFIHVLNCLGLTNYEGLTDQQKDLDASADTVFSSDTDDFKQANHFCHQDFHSKQVTSEKLACLAVVCQSPPIVKQLLDCGFMSMLTEVVLDYCALQMSKIGEDGENPRNDGMTDSAKQGMAFQSGQEHSCDRNLMIAILKFFCKVCSNGVMRDWFGGADGSSWWLPLLSVICDTNVSVPEEPSVLSILFGDDANTDGNDQNGCMALENVMIDFLSTCCWCHPPNQQLIAEVICLLICKEQSNRQENSILGISGFTRRLILQLLLENEKILVYIKSPPSIPLHKPPSCMLGDRGLGFLHPQFKCGHNVRTVYVNTQTTCQKIISSICDPNNLSAVISSQMKAKKKDKSHSKSTDSKNDIGEMGMELVNHLSLAAGALAKDKRQKDSANTEKASRPPTRRGTVGLDIMNMKPSQESYGLYHEAMGEAPLPEWLTLAQLMVLLAEQGHSTSTPYLSFNINKKSADEANDKSKCADTTLLDSASLPTTLQIFANMGGLSLLAQHLPLLYPEISRQVSPKVPSDKNNQAPKPSSSADSEWVKIDAPDDLFDDLCEYIPSTCTNTLPAMSIPPYSLAAFGLFLRLPGYAEVLLKQRRKAQCLLRLALGVTDDADGSNIFNSVIDPTLPTLPFCVLQELFDSTPLTTDDGLLLRKMALDVGAVHLLLACLSVLSHQSSDITLPGFQHEAILGAGRATSKRKGHGTSRSDDKEHLYWAKGTGFGTGSTAQSWDVEQHIMKQRCEEDHVTCLLLVLASYIKPQHCGASGSSSSSSGNTPSANGSIPPLFSELLTQSCLLPAMSSYLRNDSVLDMARHVPLYQSLLKLLRALASCSQVVSLLLPDKRQTDDSMTILSIRALLLKMKLCVDTYSSRLKANKMRLSGAKGKGKRCLTVKEETDEESEGLALLIPDIQETARIVDNATKPLLKETESKSKDGDKSDSYVTLSKQMSKSVEEQYMQVLKPLQFDTFEMITEDDSGFRFTISHHFELNMRTGGDHGHPSRARRLAQETVTLSTSLPLSYNSSIFVRCDQDRLDIMKVLITGPVDTPYANGCFVFDVYFPPDYPNSPMLINLQTTGHHTVRFNPNLYNDGKVCLSILNTWHGRPEEKWNSNTSSFLQVLVSIQSLILVADPYFNEPGYERSRGTPSGNQSSREYDANIRQATIKWGMLEQLRNPCPCFKSIIEKHLWMKRGEILQQCDMWIADIDSIGNERRRSGKAISLSAQAMKRHTAQLQEEFAKMKPPEGLESWSPEMTSGKVGSTPCSESTSTQRSEETQCMNGDLSPEEEAKHSNMTNKVNSLELTDPMYEVDDCEPSENALFTGTSPTEMEDQNFHSFMMGELVNAIALQSEDKESLC